MPDTSPSNTDIVEDLVAALCCDDADDTDADADGAAGTTGTAGKEPAAAKPRAARLPVCPHCGKKIRTRATRFTVARADGTEETWCYTCTQGHTVVCMRCGRRHLTTESVAVTDHIGFSASWCKACADSASFTCDHCRRRHSTGRRVQVYVPAPDAPPWAPPGTGPVESRLYPHGTVTESWCKDCASTDAWGCACCGERTAINLLLPVAGGERYCPSCARNAAAYETLQICPRCDQVADVTYPTDAGARLCRYCHEAELNRLRGQIYAYHGFNKRLLYYRGDKVIDPAGERVPVDLYLGFELEAGKASETGCCNAANALKALNPEEDRYHLERDGSIPRHGFELISAPHTLSAHAAYAETWRKVLAAEVKHGLRSHDCDGACGLHVHVSRDFLTASDCAKLDIFIQRNKLFWEKVARRKEVRYAKYIQKGSLGDYGNSPNRYCALNFQKSGTVEFRMYRGTLKFETLMGTLELTDAVCRWIKSRNCVQIARNHAEVKGLLNFMKADKKQYGNAIRYIIRTTADQQAEDAKSPEL
jgi:hypothetical protein